MVELALGMQTMSKAAWKHCRQAGCSGSFVLAPGGKTIQVTSLEIDEAGTPPAIVAEFKGRLDNRVPRQRKQLLRRESSL